MQYVKLTQGKQAIVDNEDFLITSSYKYHYEKRWGYARRKSNAKSKKPNRVIFLHQDIARAKYKNYDSSRDKIDHINRDTLDCRRENIRLVNASESCQNRKVFKNKLSSKYRGVYKRPSGSYWSAIFLKGKHYYLGGFKTESEAALAYNLKAKELYGEFANLNKIEG